MEYKKWLVEGFCPVDDYRCLMPVEYEAVEENGIIQEYRKNRMVCRHALEGQCPQVQQCHFFATAPDRLEKGATWYEG